MKQRFALYRDILYMHFSERFYNLPESAKNAVSPQSPLKRLLKIAGYSAVRLIGNLFQSVEEPERLRGKLWLYVVSQNNVDSLQFVQQRLPEAVFIAGQSKHIGKYGQEVARLSLRRKILYYYKFPGLLLQFLRHNRQSTRRFFDVLYDAIGFFEVYYRKLLQYNPAAVVFANDHNADARAMLLAAKALHIKTIYIQHASVSNLFPPLSFDLNLLEGQDSLDKYRQCGPVEGQVELIGMPKADAYVKYRNQSQTIQTVGVGCNLMDDLEEIRNLLVTLVRSFPNLFFIVRPHPRDSRNFAELTKIADTIRISSSRIQPTFDYLKQLDAQISGNSGIHLEAVLLNVWSIYFELNIHNNLRDYYGFVKLGLVDEAVTAQKLCSMLKVHLTAKPDVLHRAKYYSASIYTSHDGQSSEFATSKIRSFLKL